MNAGSADQEQGQQHNQYCHAGIDRTGQCLVNAVVYNGRKRESGVLQAVLTHAVIDHYSIVNAITDHGQDCSYKHGIYFNCEESAHQGIDADADQGIMYLSNYGTNAEAEGMFHLAECPGNIQQYAY